MSNHLKNKKIMKKVNKIFDRETKKYTRDNLISSMNRPINSKQRAIRYLKFSDFQNDQDGFVWDYAWQRLLSFNMEEKDIISLLESTLKPKTINRVNLIWSISWMNTSVDRFSFFLKSLDNDDIEDELRDAFEQGIMVLYLTKDKSNKLIDILEDKQASINLKRSIATIFTDLEEYEPIDIQRLVKLTKDKSFDNKSKEYISQAIKVIENNQNTSD